MQRKWMFLVLLVAVVALILFIRFSKFMEQDNCLDSGGRWQDGECIGALTGDRSRH
jgi:hypothetical protein